MDCPARVMRFGAAASCVGGFRHASAIIIRGESSGQPIVPDHDHRTRSSLQTARQWLRSPPVSWLTKNVAVLLLALWVPATLHCRLEQALSLELLSCCPHEAAEKTPAHHESDCANDGCGAVESGFYKQEETQATPGRPLPVLVVLVAPRLDDAPKCVRVLLAAVSRFPSELAKSWQFSFRAALPVRAPSFTS